MIERKDLFRTGYFTSIAGPCAIESEPQALAIAVKLRELGELSDEFKTDAFKGCILKPRTDKSSFQGIGIKEGLLILRRIRNETGFPIVTEILDPRQVEPLEEYVDVFQVGSRNCQNYSLLTELGERSQKPVLLKRGASCKIDEWIKAADYIGKDRVILCERGIRTPVDINRYTLDINGALVAKADGSKMPVIGDPSHPAGNREWVPGLIRTIAGAGLDGMIVEVHNDPGSAQCDGPQQLMPETYAVLLKQARRIYQLSRVEECYGVA